MSHEKERKEKSGKKVALKSLKEKRADKAAKRDKKKSLGSNPITLLTKKKQ